VKLKLSLFACLFIFLCASPAADIDVYQTTGVKQKVTPSGGLSISTAGAFTLTGPVNGLTITSSTGTLTIANGKTATISNTLTFTGIDSSSVAFGTGGTVAYIASPTFTGILTTPQIAMINNGGIGTVTFEATNNVDANFQIRGTAGGASPKFYQFNTTTDTGLFFGQNGANVLFIRDTGKVDVGASDSGTAMTRIRHGSATLVGGTVTVSDSTVTASSRIFAERQATGGTPGSLGITARSNGVSFTITSTSGTDTSTVVWLLIEP
jgi:hypothetical protein